MFNISELSSASNNPFMNALNTYNAGIQSQFLRPSLAEQLRQAQLENQIKQAQAHYAQPMEAAKLAVQQATAPHLQADTGYLQQQTKWYGPETEAKIGLEGSQANYYGQEAKFMPLKYALEATNQSRLGGRFGQAYQFSRALQALPPEQRSAYIAQHPDEYSDMLNTLGNKALQQDDNSGQQLIQNLMKQYYPQQYQGMQQGQEQQSQQPPTIANQFQNPNAQQTQGMQRPDYSNIGQQTQTLAAGLQPQQPSLAQNLMQQQPQQPSFTTTPEKQQQIKDIWEHDANLKNTPNIIRNRATNAVALESTYLKNRDEWAPKMKDALHYAGLLGRGQRLADEWRNEHPESVANYDWFTHVWSTLSTNGIRYLEGMGGTDQQKQELLGLTKDVVDNIRSNPKRAEASINNLMNTVQEFADGVYNAAEPVYKGTYRRQGGIKPFKGNYLDTSSSEKSQIPEYSQADLEHTAKIHGISVDEVKSKLKARGQ